VGDAYNISIITHNRPALLEKTIKSVLNAVKNRDVLIYIVWQDPKDETVEYTRQVLNRYSSTLAKITILQKTSTSPEKNIDAARLEALTIAFQDPLVKYAVVFEDDVCVSSDILGFVDSVIHNESKNRYFRGINFGSKEENFSICGYSRIRYGIHGPASVISRRTWKNSGLANSKSKLLPRTWDGYIESYLKTGFMVTPNISRYIDFGTRGTHSSGNNEDYFLGLQKSFSVLEKSEIINLIYGHQQVTHMWRHDSKKYSVLANPYYALKHYITRIQDYLESR
jgi:hypothetical protein